MEQGGHFSLDEQLNPMFYDWVCVTTAIQCVRERAGFGKPLLLFYNSRSESINKVIK